MAWMVRNPGNPALTGQDHSVIACLWMSLAEVLPHACNPSISKVEAGGPGVKGQFQLPKEFATILGYMSSYTKEQTNIQKTKTDSTP